MARPPKRNTTITEVFGIQPVDGTHVEVTASVNVKLSKHYNSAGTDLGVKVTVRASDAEESAAKLLAGLRRHIAPETEVIGMALDNPDGIAQALAD